MRVEPALLEPVYQALEYSDLFEKAILYQEKIWSYEVANQVREDLGPLWQQQISYWLPRGSAKETKSRIHAIVGIALFELVKEHDAMFNACKIDTENSGYMMYQFVG